MIDCECSSDPSRDLIHRSADENHCHKDRDEYKHGILPNNGMCMRRMGSELARGEEGKIKTRRNLNDNMNQESKIVRADVV